LIVSQTELYQSYVLINNQVLSTLHTLKLKLTIKHRDNDKANSITQIKKKTNKKTPSLTITETLEPRKKNETIKESKINS
jgi:hypothetical protein